MSVAAILVTIGTTPESSTWVVQSGQVGARYLAKVTSPKHGRGRFVEARNFLGTWRFQGRKFEDQAEAEAFVKVLEPNEGESISVSEWKDAWHEEVSDDSWCGWPKIGPAMADGDRPLLKLFRLHAEALKAKLRLVHIMPAALAFDPVGAKSVEVGCARDRRMAALATHEALRTWRKRLEVEGVSTTTLLIEEGSAAKGIASAAQSSAPR